MPYLLDTNVLSELRRGRKCNPHVRKWVAGVSAEEMFVSVLTLGEIRVGVKAKRRRDPRQGEVLENWLLEITASMASRTLDVTAAIADRWGRIPLHERLPDVDGLIAATALVHNLTVVTRNTDDFWRSGVPVVNPFEEDTAHG